MFFKFFSLNVIDLMLLQGFSLLYQGVQSFSALQFPPDTVPEFYPYVLIGNGPAVLAAAAKIREDEGDDKKVFYVIIISLFDFY